MRSVIFSVLIMLVLSGGLSLGASAGYMLMHRGVVAMEKYDLRMPLVPDIIKLRAVVQSVDASSKTITVKTGSPYDSQKPIVLKASYDSAVFTGAGTGITNFEAMKAGGAIILNVARFRAGPLHVVSGNPALQI